MYKVAHKDNTNPQITCLFFDVDGSITAPEHGFVDLDGNPIHPYTHALEHWIPWDGTRGLTWNDPRGYHPVQDYLDYFDLG